MKQHPITERPDPADQERVCALFRVLSDPTRLQLVLLLRTGEQPVRQLVGALRQPQSTVSRHLALLRSAALVQTRRVANQVYYRLTDAHLGELLTQAFSHAQHERLRLPDHPSANEPTAARP